MTPRHTLTHTACAVLKVLQQAPQPLKLADIIHRSDRDLDAGAAMAATIDLENAGFITAKRGKNRGWIYDITRTGREVAL